MKTILKGIAPIVLALGLVFGISAYAKALEAGETILIGGYCSTEQAAKNLAAATAAEGMKGFLRVLKDPEEKCIHYRMHRNRPIAGVILERVWEVRPPDTDLVIGYWTFEDKKGNVGWTWEAEDPEEPKVLPGQDS